MKLNIEQILLAYIVDHKGLGNRHRLVAQAHQLARPLL